MAATVLATRQVPVGGSVNALTVAVDFGSSRSDMGKATVTGQAWVGTNSIIVATIVPKTSNNTIEELLLERLHVSVGNLVAGVGFDIYIHAPSGTYNQYNINILGV
jgi:hypothetical protein